MEKATFAMGCFWGVEVLYKRTPGVTKTTVGYAGGHLENPTYENVCGGHSGHAEALELTYDPQLITYNQLLDLFWKHHNPTTYNQQGPDIGSQYRSAIFYHTEEQKRLAAESMDKLTEEKKYKNPIVTEIVEASEFFPAEEYHQNYFEKHPNTVCHI
ncbi:MAG: peptide-methionine (S)-S-oxide reductase MsrA [bacterium]|nr:peptide-methionine (S)-S-oxide reductase MsrA [bacterium]